MSSIKKSISIILALVMSLSTVTISTSAVDTNEIDSEITDYSVLTEPFDITYEEEVDAGIYPYDEKTVLVKLEKMSDSLDCEIISGIEYLFKAKDGFWYNANLKDGTTPKEAIETLRSTHGVVLAEYNFLYETGATTLCDGEGIHEDVHDNPRHHDQWHLDSCGFQKSWKKIKDDNKNPGGDSGVIVAVIDTGVDYDHEDLKNNMWVNSGEIPGDGIDNDKNGYIDDYYGVNIVAGRGNGDDDHGHGTHVAGIIAAANNNVGVVGIAYNTKIMAIKAGQASGYFLQTDVCKAINYARENGADVINMSFGGSASTIAVQDALEAAYTHSVLVAAAGNDGKPNEGLFAMPCYPAAYSFVLGVMAVDDYGVETTFTNYDVIGFNSVEYELYAPGSAITSTIPGDRYATWNGTSMAAPIVSGMAAILRSVYNDPDMYPTKFIYGQLASTSDRYAECLDPDAHGLHNLPQIANLYDALTKMPNPEVSVSDYTTFDTDTIADVNNSDGTLDAGETIALGFELRNRWGMSKDTIVTIDALSPADIPNPYVEFSADGVDFGDSASINYDSVGTYSTRDCGKVMEDDLWVGWENPFYLKIAKDTPNDTILAINVNIAAKNALDENDDNIYSPLPITINLIVKNGVVLPQIIDEDMTLTKDNYYIIPNTTVIEEGVTVTVTEGTNIQFWTNDATDAYADSYIAGLVVKGTLNCIGTEEEPIMIFPSDLMGNYRVEIYEKDNGEINYKYTNITNLFTGHANSTTYPGFTIAENCEFNQNYKERMRYRYLNNGQVSSSVAAAQIVGENAINCAFYKLGTNTTDRTRLYVNCDGCIFVDSYIYFTNEYAYNNCVFLGNNNYWDSDTKGGTSSMEPASFYIPTPYAFVRDEESGTTYAQLEFTTYGSNWIGNGMGMDMHKKIAEYMGGTPVYVETEEELEFIIESGLSGILGAELTNDNEFVWLNGEGIGDFIEIKYLDSRSYKYITIDSRPGYKYIRRGSYDNMDYYALIEIPGEIFTEEITLAKDSVSIDTSVTYQLAPQIYPSTAADNELLYFSSNTAVAEVDEDGLVTPISTGTATIYVFSADMQVWGSMEVNVKDEVKAAEIVAPEKLQIDIDDTVALGAYINPANTTKELSYESSDNDIAMVDENGNITAVGGGKAVITVSVFNGDEIITAETVIEVIIPVESVEFDVSTVYIAPDDTIELLPIITPEDATNQNLIWDSSNAEICYVNEDGELVGVAEGIATLKATVENTELSAYVNVCVNEEWTSSPEVVQVRYLYYDTMGTDPQMYYIITDDGNIWQYGNNSSCSYLVPTMAEFFCDGEKIAVADIGLACVDASSGKTYICLLLDQEGNVYSHSFNSSTLGDEPLQSGREFTKVAENASKLLPIGNGPLNYYSCAVILEDGSALMYGYNYEGKLGISGSGQYVKEPIKVSLDAGEKIVDGYNGYSGRAFMYLLTEGGGLYVAGFHEGNIYDTYKKVADGVVRIKNNLAFTEDSFCVLNTYPQWYTTNYDRMYSATIYIKDGIIHNDTAAGSLQLDNVVNAILTDGEKAFFITGDGALYTAHQAFNPSTIPEYLVISPITSDEPLTLREGDTNLTDAEYDESSNIVSAVLKDDKLVLGFNSGISEAGSFGDIKIAADGTLVAIKKAFDLNNLTVSIGGGFKEDVEYVLTIPASAFVNNYSIANEEITVTFTYAPDTVEVVEPEETLPEEETPSVEEVPHVHEFVTETVMPTTEEEGLITNACECGETTETVLPALSERDFFTEEDYNEFRDEFVEKGYNTNVWNSAILNRTIDDDVTKWLRITAPSGETEYGFGGNYWGTTNETLINHQILDYNDFISLGDINEGEYLTEAPENTFPFVTDAYIMDADGDKQDVVSHGKVLFVVEFNRDMDMEHGLNVYFGSAYPYADYEIYGEFADERTWVGEATLKTVIENGYQFIRVTNGRTAPDENGNHLKLYTDWARFGFEIDTTAAMAMMMQGYADDDGIHLEWMQDDYDTLAGYNVYRATSEDGNYVRINDTVISPDENTYVDTDIEPGVRYYYTFTVVLTSIGTDTGNESSPAGKISITAKDTMAPSVYHSPVYTATTGSKVIISATVSDNIGIQNAVLYYRIKGTEDWKSAEMTSSNDKYTASVPSSFVTLDGIEYYIAAYDGLNYTYAGSHTSENPYEITVYQAVETNAKGDVDGDGNITVLDALKLLRAIYDETLLTQEQFLRADINDDGTLSAVEALRILQYANKKISSVLF